VLDPLIRTMLLIRDAGQAAILAKVLLTNSFFAACRRRTSPRIRL